MNAPAHAMWDPPVSMDVSADDVMDVFPGFVWRLDRDFRFTHVSDKARNILGVEVDAFLGARMEELGFRWEAGLDPLESRAAFQNQRVIGPAHQGRHPRLALSGKPIFETSQGFVGYVGSAVEIDPPGDRPFVATGPEIVTASTMEPSPAALLETFRNAVECLADGFALFDSRDRLVYCNASFRRMNENARFRFDGKTTFEMIVRSNVERGLLEDAVGREECFIAERMARHGAPSDEPRLMRWTDGNVLLVRERRMADGGTVVVNTDMTELSRREKALAGALGAAEQASRAKSLFLARMSHELRTPLNAIIGFSDLVLSETFGPLGSERYRTYIGDVKDSGEHLLALINDLLDLTGIESGRREFVFDAHRPRDLVSAALRAVRPIGRRAGVRLRGSASADLPSVNVDARSMHQCLLNLVSNAIKASRRGGRVAIRVERGGADTLCFSVCDTGNGMSDAAISRLMTMSGLNDQDYIADADGTGLGLPITKSLVEVMGGRLEIDSQIGGGTRARLIVPVVRR